MGRSMVQGVKGIVPLFWSNTMTGWIIAGGVGVLILVLVVVLWRIGAPIGRGQ